MLKSFDHSTKTDGVASFNWDKQARNRICALPTATTKNKIKNDRPTIQLEMVFVKFGMIVFLWSLLSGNGISQNYQICKVKVQFWTVEY